MIPEEAREVLENQKYKIIGKNGAVKLCHWLKEAMKGNKGCYKQRFYGIESHRCLQMTPTVAQCSQKCIFCWRAYEAWNQSELKEVDDPKRLLDEAISAQRKLLTGFGGSLDIYEKDLWEESKHPKHVAISLSGEPTLYPKLNNLLREVHDRGMTSFLVSNGLHPETIKELNPTPTQLYISLDASDKNNYKKICRPQIKNGWKRLNKSLDLLSDLNTRTVLRITLMKGINDEVNKNLIELIEKSEPDFIEVKSFMHIGYSRKRMKREKMVTNDEIKHFSKELAQKTNLNYFDNVETSRVALLNKRNPKLQ